MDLNVKYGWINEDNEIHTKGIGTTPPLVH